MGGAAVGWLGLASALMVACATGAESADGLDLGEGAGGDGGFGGGYVSGAGGEGALGSGGMGGAGMAEGGGGMAMECSYESPNSCPQAISLGMIAGDEKGAPVVVKGSTSKWFKIHVVEAVSSIFSEDLSYTVKLDSAPGMDFALYVHEGPEDGEPDCNAPPKVGSGTTTKTVSGKWDDDQGIGGEDDSVWLSIEVRYVSGELCGAAAEWTLTITGKT